MTSWWEIPSPVGRLRLVSDGEGVRGISFESGTRNVSPAEGWRRSEEPFRELIAELAAYFAGRLDRFSVRVAPEGTAFQQDVWAVLRTIPYGETVTYGEIARRIGRSPASSSRAVGAANGANPIPLVIPCHRVVGADGSLTGFGGGLAIKRRLLDLEAGHRELFR